VTQRDHESLAEHDPHSLLFGPDDAEHDGAPDGRHADDGWHAGELEPGDRILAESAGGGRASRRAEARRRRTAHTRRILVVLGTVVVIVAAVSAWVVVPKVSGLFGSPDYQGSGTGHVTITVNPGDSTTDIANTLHAAGVVKSAGAFTDAAADNPAVTRIQPGAYVLHEHMSGAAAVKLLLDPASRNAAGDVVVIEGATGFDVAERLGRALGDNAKSVLQTIAHPADLGLPLGYTADGKPPASAEGFLYPATYNVDPNSSPASALQKMITKFTDEDRTMGFAAKAKTLGLTPYQALIIASMAQSEAKFPDDMAKVVRVILNRLKAGKALEIDATTRYGALLNGVDPNKVAYHNYDTPYNTYTNGGLPPTPISNPGEDAMKATVNPASGKWMYYVNGDAEGHLFFTDDEHAFLDAVDKCREHNWGCG
jgi:UPF0755 protein